MKQTAGLVARLLVGAVFVYSGFLKAVAPAEEFAYAIETYRVVSSSLALLIAFFLPWLELYLGVILIAGLFTRYLAIFSGALFIGFEILLLQAIIRKLPVTSCGCFGASSGNSLQREFSQNLIFMALTLIVWLYGESCSADSALKEPVPDTVADRK